MPQEEKKAKPEEIKENVEEVTQKQDQTILDEEDVEEVVETDVENTESVANSEEELPEVEDAVKAEQVSKGVAKSYFDGDSWTPKTELGRKVKSGEITSLKDILNDGNRILEPEIVDYLIPNYESDLLLIGQAKGKFGGGQRRVFRQCQKKTREGNKPSFATCAIVGNRNGFIGFGYGKARETVPAREKAIRQAKQNMIKVRRGSGSWEGAGDYPNSIPYKVTGKCGSVIVELIPAPNGTGLCIEKECAKMLSMAGIQDVWSKTRGQTKTKINQVKACFEALKKLSSTKVNQNFVEKLNIVDGMVVDEQQ